jgi:hypothetical protein
VLSNFSLPDSPFSHAVLEGEILFDEIPSGQILRDQIRFRRILSCTMRAGRDMRQAQDLCGFTLELLILPAKARKVLDVLLEHRDLNPIGEKPVCQKSNRSRFLDVL